MSPPLVREIDPDTVSLTIDTTIYTEEAIMRTLYQFTDEWYVKLSRVEEQPAMIALVTRKHEQSDLKRIVDEFFNALLDQELRIRIAAQTEDVRTLIVAQAFAEGNLLSSDNDPSER